jgi:hypothetical protein
MANKNRKIIGYAGSISDNSTALDDYIGGVGEHEYEPTSFKNCQSVRITQYNGDRTVSFIPTVELPNFCEQLVANGATLDNGSKHITAYLDNKRIFVLSACTDSFERVINERFAYDD